MSNRKFCLLNCDPEDSESFLFVLRDFQDLDCVGVSDNFETSFNLVLKTTPDIIVIDIDTLGQGRGENPFALITELFQFLDYSPTFVALSSSTEKAYDVIKLGFFDYLLKPLKEVDIRKFVLRLRKELKNLIPLKICLKSNSDYRFIDLDNILYLQADNNSTDFHLKNDNKVSGFKPLKHYEELLPDNFLRVHNSYIINSNYLVRISFGKSSLALGGIKEKIPFSRAHRDKVEMLRNSLSYQHTLQA